MHVILQSGSERAGLGIHCITTAERGCADADESAEQHAKVDKGCEKASTKSTQGAFHASLST